MEPFRKKGSNVHQKRCRADKHLGVPGPTETFIPLRAVGRNIEEVALLSPKDVMLQLVHKRVRTGELPCPFHGRMQHDTREILQPNGLVETVKPDIPEALER